MADSKNNEDKRPSAEEVAVGDGGGDAAASSSSFSIGKGEKEEGEGEATTLSKKSAKKADKKAQKEAKKAEREELAAQQRAAAEKTAEDIDGDCFGYLPLNRSEHQTERKWFEIGNLTAADGKAEKSIWLRARLQDCRGKGSLVFLILRQQENTIQCVLDSGKGLPKEMLKWTAGVPAESIVDVFGIVRNPNVEISSTTSNVELHAVKVFCVSKALSELPFQLKDANLPDSSGNDTKEEAIRVSADVRLDNRILDLRTRANMAIFRIQSAVCQLFRQHLLDHNFIEIHSPKLIGGASEGGANCFGLDYFGRKACLAQSPQLYKQMVLSGDMDRVFEIGPVFRADNSNTHRHLCEFVGLDFEMTFKDHFFEVVHFIDETLKTIFRGLQEKSKKELEVVAEHHPAEPFVFAEKTPMIDYKDGIQMLRDVGAEGIPDDIEEFDLSTPLEKLLGKVVKEKFATDYFVLLHFPTKVRPFYSMPSAKDPTVCNSYDFYMRGEEILSGAQRIHDSAYLRERCIACGVSPESIQPYIDAFSLGAYPHAGCGIGLERVVMFFLGLPNVRKTSLFPRDPKRLTP